MSNILNGGGRMAQKYICAVNRCLIVDNISNERCKCYNPTDRCPLGTKTPIWIKLKECDGNERTHNN